MMPKLLPLMCLLALVMETSAQDGSDMRSVKTQDVDNTCIGKCVHMDFYNRSFRGRKIDTIAIQVNGVPVNFVEHRVDNGYDNWFSDQFLEAINYPGTLRIERFQVKKITRDSFQVIAYFTSHDSKNGNISNSVFTDEYWFAKNIIAEVLITDKDFQ